MEGKYTDYMVSSDNVTATLSNSHKVEQIYVCVHTRDKKRYSADLYQSRRIDFMCAGCM